MYILSIYYLRLSILEIFFGYGYQVKSGKREVQSKIEQDAYSARCLDIQSSTHISGGFLPVHVIHVVWDDGCGIAMATIWLG